MLEGNKSFTYKVNVAVAASLATAGAENTQVNIHSVPNMIGDDHKITAEMGELRL